jgi:hypothetical protein
MAAPSLLSSCRRVLSWLPVATLTKDILIALFDLAVGWNNNGVLQIFRKGQMTMFEMGPEVFDSSELRI